MTREQRQQKAWRDAHVEQRRAYARRYYQAHKAEFAAASKQWAKDHPELRKSVKNGSRYFRTYGITLSEYEDMLRAQGGLCAICRQPERAAGRSLAVDHCHTTNRVRGLLCMRCNIALGMYEDDVLRMRAALAYLEGRRVG